MNLLLATSNVHKIREMKAILKEIKRFDLYSLHDFPSYRPPYESGKTFEENAVLKAKDAASKLGMLAIADDSGLVVPKLNNAPGVYSARYAGPNASDKDNRKKLLKEMERLEGLERAAYFECVIALAAPKNLIRCFKGSCEGLVIQEEKGRGGFGYDPLFQKYDYNQTFAELEELVKNRISHRGKALEKFMIFLESYHDSHLQ